MKKLLICLLLLLNFPIFGQNIFDSLNQKIVYKEYIITDGPTIENFDDGTYNISITWKNTNTSTSLICLYSFSKDSICRKVVQFSPIKEKEVRISIIEMVKEKLGPNFKKDSQGRKKFWVDELDGKTILLTIKDIELMGVKGILTTYEIYDK